MADKKIKQPTILTPDVMQNEGTNYGTGSVAPQYSQPMISNGEVNTQPLVDGQSPSFYDVFDTQEGSTQQKQQQSQGQQPQPQGQNKSISDGTPVYYADDGSIQASSSSQDQQPTPEQKAEVGEVQPMGGDFSVYATGQQDLTQDNPDFDKFDRRLRIFNAISGVGAEKVGNLIADGKLRPGTQAMRDLQRFNPELYQQAQQISQQRQQIDNINESVDKMHKGAVESKKFSLAKTEKQKQEEINPTAPVNDYISEELRSRFGEYAGMYSDLTQELMQAPNVQKHKDEVFDKKQQLNELDQQIDDLYEEAGRVLGDEAPDYLRSAYVSTKAKEINRLRKPLLMELELAQSQLQMEVEDQMNRLDQVTKGMQTDLKNKQWMYQQQYKAEQDQIKQQQRQQQQEYKMAQDQQAFQYKQEQDAIKNQLSQEKYNLTQDKFSYQQQQDILKGKGTTGMSTGQTALGISDGQTGGQCGAFVNDISEASGGKRIFKDSYEDKAKLATETEPAVGAYIVMQSPGEYAEYGHVGVVVGVDGDKVTVKSSNLHGDEKISTETYDVSDPNITGYHYPENMKVGSDAKKSLYEAVSGGYGKITIPGKGKGTTKNVSPFSKEGKEALGFAGKDNFTVQSEFSPEYIKNTVQDLNNPDELYNSMKSLSNFMDKETNIDGKPLFSTPSEGMYALKNSGVSLDTATQVFGRWMSEKLSEYDSDEVDIDVSGENVGTSFAGTSPVEALADFLYVYDVDGSDTEKMKETLRTIMDDDTFASAVNEGGFLGLGMGKAYNELFEKAIKRKLEYDNSI